LNGRNNIKFSVVRLSMLWTFLLILFSHYSVFSFFFNLIMGMEKLLGKYSALLIVEETNTSKLPVLTSPILRWNK
jgi:hypothetical protein